MKDKRQRMALTWPYANPHLAAYMFAAAAAAYGQTQGAYWNTAAAAAAAAAVNATTGAGAQSAQAGGGDNVASGHGPISPSMYSMLPQHLYHPLMMQPQAAPGHQLPTTTTSATSAGFLGLQLNTDHASDSIDLNKSLPSGGSGDGTSHCSRSSSGSALSSPASSPVPRSSPISEHNYKHFSRPLVSRVSGAVPSHNTVSPPTESSSGAVKKLFQPYKMGEDN